MSSHPIVLENYFDNDKVVIIGDYLKTQDLLFKKPKNKKIFIRELSESISIFDFIDFRIMSIEERNKKASDEMVKIEKMWNMFSNDKIIFKKSEDEDVNILFAFIGNKDALKELVNSPSENVRVEVAKHKNIETLKILSKDPSYFIRKEVAKHNIEFLLKILSKDEHEDVRLEVARHKNIEILKILSKDPSYFVRRQVAKHNVEFLLEELSEDEHEYVRMAVAKHNNFRILEKMINDDSFFVLSEIARHDQIILLRILFDRYKDFKREKLFYTIPDVIDDSWEEPEEDDIVDGITVLENIATHKKHVDMLRELSFSEYESVRKSVAINCKNFEILNHLKHDRSSFVRAYVASSSTHIEILNYLMNDPDEKIRFESKISMIKFSTLFSLFSEKMLKCIM